MNGFSTAEERWIARLGGLRNVIRQEVIARQLSDHVGDTMSVLDVGCGQGTQALRLAERGCGVTGVDPSDELLSACAADAEALGVDVQLLRGGIDNLPELLEERTYDVVCAHGLMMYLDDRVSALGLLAAHLAPQGRLSVTFRNAHALAMRPGLRKDWPGALKAFDADHYVNELGVAARADHLEDIEQDLADLGLHVADWYGVRVFNDAVVASEPIPTGNELRLLLDAEDAAGRRDPYRWMGSQIHVVAMAELSATTATV